MGLSKKVLLLWNVRAFLFSLLFFLFMDFFLSDRLWAVLSSLFLMLISSAVLYLRFRFCTFEVTEEGIIIRKGILIRKTLYIKYRFVIAVNRIRTPLSAYMGISSLIIYCEGSTFLLPPLENSLTQQIEKHIKTEG